VCFSAIPSPDHRVDATSWPRSGFLAAADPDPLGRQSWASSCPHQRSRICACRTMCASLSKRRRIIPLRAYHYRIIASSSSRSSKAASVLTARRGYEQGSGRRPPWLGSGIPSSVAAARLILLSDPQPTIAESLGYSTRRGCLRRCGGVFGRALLGDAPDRAAGVVGDEQRAVLGDGERGRTTPDLGALFARRPEAGGEILVPPSGRPSLKGARTTL